MNALTNIFSSGYNIVKTNRSDINHVACIQQQLFRKLLQFTSSNSEFYKELYAGLDIENCQLQDLPTITKSNMMANFDFLVTDKNLKLLEIQNWLADKTNEEKLYKGKYIPVTTSGSTGENALIVYSFDVLTLFQTAIQFRLGVDTKQRAHDYLKIIASQFIGSKLRIAILSVPRGNIFTLARYSSSSHHLFVRKKMLSIFDPIDKLVNELNSYQPHRLMVNSHFVATLAREQLAGRLKISFDHPLSCLAAGGEVLTENTKRLAFDAWGVNVRNIYGASECYLMATSCHESDNLHVMSDLCIIEIVDKDNKPVRPGQYGHRILLTNLHNYTQPIIRYEIEDVTSFASQSCGCDAPFPILTSIKGRTMDFLYFKNKNGGYEKLDPYRIEVHLRYEINLWQYQIVQTARNELTFLYVPRDKSVDIKKKLLHMLRKAFSRTEIKCDVAIKVKQVDSISREVKSGKFKIVKSLGKPAGLVDKD